MKKPLVISLLIATIGCSSDEPESAQTQCFDGIEIIQNNPDSEVFTDEEGFLVIRINDPQSADDVVLKYTTEGFVTDRTYYMTVFPVISDFETEQDTSIPPTAFQIAASVAYDFEVDNPIIHVQANGAGNNFIFPGFTRGNVSQTTSSQILLQIALEGGQADVSAGNFTLPFTWDGFELPDPLVTSLSFGVQPNLERNFDTQYLEFRIQYIDIEDPDRVFNEERTMMFNFDCD